MVFIGDKGKQEDPVKIALQPFFLVPNMERTGLSCLIKEHNSAIVQPIAHMSILVSYFLVSKMTSGALYHLEVTWRDSFLLYYDLIFLDEPPPSSSAKPGFDPSVSAVPCLAISTGELGFLSLLVIMHLANPKSHSLT